MKSRYLTRVFGAASLVGGVLLFSTCSWEDPFPEYAGVNLIGDRGQSVDAFAAAHMDGSDPAAFEYVRVTSVTAAEFGDDAAGLPEGLESTVRRLEAVNIFPDGDFEQSAAGLAPEDWDVTLPSPPNQAPSVFVVDDSGVIQGNSLEFATAGQQAAVLDLDAHARDGWVPGARYFLSLQMKRGTATMVMTFDYGDGIVNSYLDNQRWTIGARADDTTPIETLPSAEDPSLNIVTLFSASVSGDSYFYVGSPEGADGQSGYVDNIKIGRLDPMPHVSLPVARENADGGLPLVASQYRFSVYVKSEIADQVTPSPDGANRYRAGQIVLGMNDRWELFTQADHEWDASTWVQISAVFRLYPDDLLEDPPMSLRLAIAHDDVPAIGSILIAEPRLEIFSTE